MRIYQRKGVWYIDYSFNGRRVRKKVGTSRKMAELALNETELKIVKKKFLGINEPKRMIFDKLCEEYLQFSKANKRPLSHLRDITSIKSLNQSFGNMLITDITAQGLELHKNRRHDEVKPATTNREISCIKHMFTKAIHWDYLRKNPLRSVKKFREPPGRVRYLKENEIAKLLYCCAEHIKPVVITALNTGMRKGEILNLKWSDVDIVKRIITIRDSKNHESRHIPIGFLRFNFIDKSSGNVWLRMMIGEKQSQGKGYAREALHHYLKWMFGTLGIHRITIECYSTNLRAIKFFKKIGFKKEGILREAVFINEKYRDIISLGLLKKEFKSTTP